MVKRILTLSIYSLFLAIFAFGMTGSALADSSSPGNNPSINSSGGSGLSFNWSGYQATSGTYSSVSGSWVVPSVSGTPPSGDATWIGIGGISTSDLIQTGTQAILDPSNPGQIEYAAWIEMLPNATTNIPVTIHAGDSVSASIVEQGTAGNEWLITFRDNTTGQTYQSTENYQSSMSSAEWIEEMPTVENGGFLPIDNFGMVQFTGATAVQNGMSMNLQQMGATTLSMITRGGQVLASPSGFGADEQSFSVTRTSAAYTSASGAGYSGYGTGTSTRTFPYGRHGGRPGSVLRRFSQSGYGSGSGSGFTVSFHRFSQMPAQISRQINSTSTLVQLFSQNGLSVYVRMFR